MISLADRRSATILNRGNGMSAYALPVKLRKEPLVDALFEIRFSSSVPASSILPGLLFSGLAASTGAPTLIERLPISDVPSQIRSADPVLKFQPLVKLSNGRFLIMVGDASVLIACELPYAGWTLFKAKIIEIIGILRDTHLIQAVERYSMKYVDIVDGSDITEQIKRTNIELQIGTHKLVSEPFTIRIEIKRDNLIHIVQIGTPSTALLRTGVTRTGILIDVDTVIDNKTSDFETFIHELPDRLELIHTQNKTMFFECLTQEAINYLEPVYDTLSA
jgi:uncharacterized protein (TIGR04255 family)